MIYLVLLTAGLTNETDGQTDKMSTDYIALAICIWLLGDCLCFTVYIRRLLPVPRLLCKV